MATGCYKIIKAFTLGLVILISVLWVDQVHAGKMRHESQSVSWRKYYTLTLGIQQDEVIPTPEFEIDFNGDCEKIVGFEFLKEISTIRFTPKEEGVCTITPKNKQTNKVFAEMRIAVKKGRIDIVANEVRELLRDIEGIEIKVRNNKIVIDGQVLLPKDISRIYDVVMTFHNEKESPITSLVKLSPLHWKKLTELITRDINNPEITVRAINEKIILEGTVASDADRNRAQEIAQIYVQSQVVNKAEGDVLKAVRVGADAVNNIINNIAIKDPPPQPPEKIIQIVVHYVELNKDYNKMFRFSWMPNLVEDEKNGLTFNFNGGGESNSDTSIAGVINNLFPKLNWAKTHGHARVLNSATVVTKHNTWGRLSSGQSVPNSRITETGAVVPDKPIDVKTRVDIKPMVMGERGDTIELEMVIDVAALVGVTAAGALTSSNRIETTIPVRSGQSAAIGGLIKNDSNTGYNRLPAGSPQNPIVSLHASKDYLRKQSQFVIFVTPSIKSSASAGSEKVKQKFKLRD